VCQRGEPKRQESVNLTPCPPQHLRQSSSPWAAEKVQSAFSPADDACISGKPDESAYGWVKGQYANLG
jgi:hypothetical protein